MSRMVIAIVVLATVACPPTFAAVQITVTSRVLVDGVESTEVEVGQDFQLEVWVEDTSTPPNTPAGFNGAFCSVSWDGALAVNNDNIDDDWDTVDEVKAVLNPVFHWGFITGTQEAGSSFIWDIGGACSPRTGHQGAVWLVRLNFTALAVGDPHLEVITDVLHFPIFGGHVDEVIIIGPELTIVSGEPSGFVLTTMVEPAGSGTVIRDPDLTHYPDGTDVWLTAIPATGFRFIDWEGDLDCSPGGGYGRFKSGPGDSTPQGGGFLPCDEPEIGVTVDEDKTIIATFAPLGGTHYSLTLNANPPEAGEIEAVPSLTSYPQGTVVTLTANPKSGYEFSAWSGQASGTNQTIMVVMNTNLAITANFEEAAPSGPFKLVTVVDPADSGKIIRTPDQEKYEAGTSVGLTAVAAEGFVFSSWSGVTLAIGSDAVVIMDSDKEVWAHFEGSSPQGGTDYLLAAEALPAMGGSVSVSPLLTTYPAGTEVTLTALPAEGYTFSGWAGAATGSANPLTLTIDGNTSVTAHFQTVSQAAGSYTLTVDVTPGSFAGTVRVSPDLANYPPGTVVTLQAEPAFGFTLTGWGGDASGSNELVSMVINRDLQIEARFGLMFGPEACGEGALPFMLLTLGVLGLVARARRP